MKKLLYIHHSYQNKTKSNHFLRQLLESQYVVDYFAFDPYGKKFPFEELKNKKYDVVVLFQIMPSIKELSSVLEFEHGVFFPMFDGAPNRGAILWYEYKDFRIINFSKTLHEELLELGFDSHYFQYFPKPAENFQWGDENSLFFWQRINQINVDLLGQVLDTEKLSHIHLHKAVDPGHAFLEPNADLAQKCSFSDWFEKKEDLNAVIEQSALYFAPRSYEGIGLSFLEAMAMGRCVIAPDNPTMNEYIVHNETGFLYDFEEPKKISLENVQQIQKNAYEYIKSGYEKWEKEKYAILDLIELPVQETVKIESFYRPYYIKVPFLTVLYYENKKKYYLFKKIPVVQNYNCGWKKEYSIFKIPVYKRLHHPDSVEYCFFKIPVYKRLWYPDAIEHRVFKIPVYKRLRHESSAEYRFFKLPVYKWAMYATYIEYSLFKIPYRVYGRGWKKKYCLFNIPLIKRLVHPTYVDYYLFGLILIMRIKKEG